MRKLLAGALVASVLVLAAVASAAPPVASGTISGPNEAGPYVFTADPDYLTSSRVTFTTTTSGLKGNQYPLVYVECVSVVDGAVLYGQLDLPETAFLLGGGSSPWWGQRDDAHCVATLYVYGGKTIVSLGSTEFEASAT